MAAFSFNSVGKGKALKVFEQRSDTTLNKPGNTDSWLLCIMDWRKMRENAESVRRVSSIAAQELGQQ